MGEPFKAGSIGAEFLAEVHRGSGTAAEIAKRIGRTRDYGNTYLGIAYRRGLVQRTDTIPAVYWVEAPPGNG